MRDRHRKNARTLRRLPPRTHPYAIAYCGRWRMPKTRGAAPSGRCTIRASIHCRFRGRATRGPGQSTAHHRRRRASFARESRGRGAARGCPRYRARADACARARCAVRSSRPRGDEGGRRWLISAWVGRSSLGRRLHNVPLASPSRSAARMNRLRRTRRRVRPYRNLVRLVIITEFRS
jgi:hypothetical protein